MQAVEDRGVGSILMLRRLGCVVGVVLILAGALGAIGMLMVVGMYDGGFRNPKVFGWELLCLAMIVAGVALGVRSVRGQSDDELGS